MKEVAKNLIKNSQYHDFEISICGFSGSGKTTLLNKLIRSFTPKYKVGYVKSDAHFFQMDYEKKDTAVAWQAGANAVHIFDKTHIAYLKQGQMDMVHQRTLFENNDFVLIEGRKNSSIPKIIAIGGKGDILQLVANGEIHDVIAFVGEEVTVANLPVSVPYFQRNDINEIKEFILQFFQQKINMRELNGIILSGGKSSRMKTDKALLSLDGKTQLQRTFNVLKPFCNSVFVSARPGQRSEEETHNLSIIEDRFLGFGPLGGIVSAQMQMPHVTWLVVACDLPCLDNITLENLVNKRNPFKLATAYESTHDGMPEPLCAIYEPRSIMRFMQFLAMGYQCPRKVLLNSSVTILSQPNKDALTNMNHPEEFDTICQALRKEKNDYEKN